MSCSAETLKCQTPQTGPLGEAVKKAFEQAAPTLQQIEERIRSRFTSDAPALSEISGYLLSLGGKRIRPLLCTLSSRLFGMASPSPALIDTAAGIELIHMATLLHDDIIDQSPRRRKKPSAFERYGLTPSLLTGDFLLVRAFGLCAHLDDFVIDATERACIELTEGEVLEGILDGSRTISIEDYLNIVRRKTSSLFALAASMGAHLAQTTPDNVRLMRDFGDHAGTAFQMIDDILDIVADEDLLGKPAGTDLRQKTPSLINILWLDSGDPEAREFFSLEQPSPAQAQQALTNLKSSTVVGEARGIARTFASKANSALLQVEDKHLQPEIRDSLFALVEYTLERCL